MVKGGQRGCANETKEEETRTETGLRIANNFEWETSWRKSRSNYVLVYNSRKDTIRKDCTNQMNYSWTSIHCRRRRVGTHQWQFVNRTAKPRWCRGAGRERNRRGTWPRPGGAAPPPSPRSLPQSYPPAPTVSRCPFPDLLDWLPGRSTRPFFLVLL